MQCQGTEGVVTTPHPLASEVALQVLAEGGTAIDAMIAAGAALAALFPHMTGLGGDALWLLDDGKVHGLMGIGQAGLTPPAAPSLRGPGAVITTAGALASWHKARDISSQQWGSRLSLSRLLEPAIGYAEGGCEVTPAHAFWIAQRQTLPAALPDLRAIMLDGSGQPFTAGARFSQPRLANTLRQLSRCGLQDFYQGELAKELAAGFAALGAGLTFEDLRVTFFNITQAQPTDLVQVRYRAGTYYNFPAPSQGLYTAQALTSLNHWSLAEVGESSWGYYHLMVEAIKYALARRNQELRDPDAVPLDSQAIAELAIPLSPDTAAPWQEPGAPADTVWSAATDRVGRTACLMQSLFHDFGSGCMIGDTGVLWHNRGAGFSKVAGHPNAWSPGKRPAHTLNPSCYIADAGTRLFFGSQGGDGQPQTQLVLATQLIDFAHDPATALAAPRFLLGRSFFDGSDGLKLEASIPPSVQADLAARGHPVEVIPALSPYTGQAGIIAVGADGVATAAHDPRGEGVALALNRD